MGGHAVVIVGWGNETSADGKQIPYWIVRNSWGPEWGDGGYFKFLRGSNHCEIEENVIVGVPSLFGFRLFLEWPLLFRTEDLALREMWAVKPSGYKLTTFEKMTLGMLEPDLEIIAYQYDPQHWPDCSLYIAAEENTHVYRIGDFYNPRKHPYLYLKLGWSAAKTYYALGAASGAAVVLAGFGIYLLIKKKKPITA